MQFPFEETALTNAKRSRTTGQNRLLSQTTKTAAVAEKQAVSPRPVKTAQSFSEKDSR